MVDAVLPRAQAAANGGGPFTREWYDFFRAIQPLTADNTELQAEINAILVRLEALEDAPIDYATINGLASVEVLGSIESGLVQILLEGDTDAPGNTYYYGTDATGVKGWHTVASAFTEGAGITLTVGADGVTDVAHADTSAVVDISANFTGGTVPEEISFTFDTFGHVLTRTITGRTLDHNDTGALQGGNSTERYHLSAAEHTKVQALPAASQPLDATLTALAGQDWAQNAVPIGTGVDTVAQVAFAANTFPARASTGDLVAKPITDDALLLLADSDVPRLGTGNSWSGTNTFTASPLKFAPSAGAGEQQIDVVASVTGDFTWLRGGVRRWQLRMNSTAESGGNAGSDLDFRYYTDAGAAALGARWARSTGVLNFSFTPTVLTTPLALITSSITDSDTTHSPSGDAVFDALATKLDLAGGTMTGNITVGTDIWRITANTTDGSDTRSIIIDSGVNLNPNRGAYIRVNGNEASSNPGSVLCISGNGADIIFSGGTLRPNADNLYSFGSATFRWSIVYTHQLYTHGKILFKGIITPTALAANTDNWAPTGYSDCSTIRASASAPVNLTGIQGGEDGKEIKLMNIGANTITLIHDLTSTAANRFLCPNNTSVALRQNGWVTIIYDGTSSRWRVMGA